MKTPTWFRYAGLVCLSTLWQGVGFSQHYTLNLLTSDGSVTAPNTDPNLVNAWGLSRGTGSPWWVADNGTGKSTLYDQAGVPQSLVVTIPSANGSGTGTPTGTIFNGSQDFQLTPKNAAIFLFCTEDGTVSGWNPAVNPSTAVIKVNKSGAVYKGLTAAVSNGEQYLYVANFSSGQVDVFDANFNPSNIAFNGFRTVETSANHLAPFNIQNIGGTLYVAYAKPDAQKLDNVRGPGLGFLAAFTPTGHLLKKYQFGEYFNAPWGIALAPSDFGSFSHTLLSGQFGSGLILAFNLQTGEYVGTVADENGVAIQIPGLWGISFGGGGKSGNFNTLYFGAGPDDESHGVFGTLTPAQADLIQGNDL